MTHLIRLAAAALAAIAIGVPPALAQEKESRALVETQELLTEAHSALAANDEAALRSAIEQAFAFDIWERFLIENRADRFTPEQRAEFRRLMPGYMAHLYNEQFDRGLDQPPLIGEARPARNDVLVGATFKRANSRDLPVEWRLRDIGGQMQVIDVMVGGTSFLLLKRDEFAAMIDRGGAEAALQHMRQNSI